jgi:hypothetical protein
MHHAARTARQHHNTLRFDTLDRQTERVYRPTLLKEGSAADNLCHRPSSYRNRLPAQFIWFVLFIWLVSFNQKNQTDQTNQTTIFLERPKGQHRQHPHHIRKHTRIEHGRPCTARRRAARQLLLVDEFTGENQHRERQGQRPACLRPSVGAADDEIRREKSTEEENQRCQNEPD